MYIAIKFKHAIATIVLCMCDTCTEANIYTAYSSDPLSVPSFTMNTATSTSVVYRVERTDDATIRVITGYEVFHFGVPMLGEYVNARTMRTVTISPVVPGAQYRITAWALDSGTRRSATPAVKSVVTGEESEYRRLTTECFESAFHAMLNLEYRQEVH